MVIYKVTNKVNDKIYVGQSTKSEEEFLKSNYYGGTYILRALKKHGIETFERMIIVYGIETMEELNRQEIYFIDKLNSKVPNGYNIANGGNSSSGYKHSEETLQKISLILTGRKFSEETKIKLSLTHTGKKFSEEHKRKLSESHKGKKRKKFSEETKRKMSKIAKNRKKVICEYCNKKLYHLNYIRCHGDNWK